MQEIFERVGANYGFERVEVEWTQAKDFKCKWVRTATWISFKLSDYMKGMPSDAVEGLATCLFEKIRGNTNAGYGEAATSYLMSDAFVEKNQRKYITRQKLESDDGMLAEAYDSLVADGLVEYDPMLALRWGNTGFNAMKPSTMMRVIAISQDLKFNADMDEIRYVIYMGINFIALGPDKSDMENRLKEASARFPNADEIEERLLKKHYII